MDFEKFPIHRVAISIPCHNEASETKTSPQNISLLVSQAQLCKDAQTNLSVVLGLSTIISYVHVKKDTGGRAVGAIIVCDILYLPSSLATLLDSERQRFSSCQYLPYISRLISHAYSLKRLTGVFEESTNFIG